MKLLKDTNSQHTKLHGRWYDDACGTAFGLEVVGERWALLIVRELMLGGRRFSDIRRELPGISAKVLTERLDGLERAGVLTRQISPPPHSARLYELTEWGYQAEGVMQELGRWAARSPLHDPTMPLSPVSLMMSIRTMINREKAAQLAGNIGFVIGRDMFLAVPSGDTVAIRRASALDEAHAIFEAPAAPVLAAAFYGPAPFEELEAGAGLIVTGDRALAHSFADLLELPPKTV